MRGADNVVGFLFCRDVCRGYAMQRIIFHIGDKQRETVESLASSAGISMSECVRRMIDSWSPLSTAVLSGALVHGVYAKTSSGDVVIGRGF